jgi:AbrB family looped-hinge helix DNA binding protein
MRGKLTMDKAGRVSLPKGLRDRRRLAAGNTLPWEFEGDRITLRPVRPKVALQKEHGVWVFDGEPAANSIPDLINQQRVKRTLE